MYILGSAGPLSQERVQVRQADTFRQLRHAPNANSSSDCPHATILPTIIVEWLLPRVASVPD
ncbi:hypothetical protein PISMIDRAFT_684282 [Pisolithus microcarpus 441]|uniref:Uncharacterized protein n=1 Tax=Pisolithus microcarpus 441 TaxID=765257 RepID=A0A0C9YNX4_9AGAM|nr:hypothetical protein PISMIDRAFT_684282 [Pisolithus microcarpus 441]